MSKMVLPIGKRHLFFFFCLFFQKKDECLVSCALQAEFQGLSLQMKLFSDGIHIV